MMCVSVHHYVGAGDGGAFAKLQIATISFVMSVGPHGTTQSTDVDEI
jgi:hypothetical protein